MPFKRLYEINIIEFVCKQQHLQFHVTPSHYLFQFNIYKYQTFTSSPSNIALSMGDNNNNVNLPPGFRFYPTDEELLVHFLHRKASLLPCHPDVIPDLDLFPYDPWELHGILYFFFILFFLMSFSCLFYPAPTKFFFFFSLFFR